MHPTWKSKLAELGMTVSERDGVARSSGMHATDGSLVDLSHFGVLAFEGVDAKSFLQGYLTCDMDLLSQQTAQLGVLCNLQGRTVADMVVVEDRGRILLWMHASVVATFQEALRKYLMFSKSKVRQLDDWVSVGNLAPKDTGATALRCIEDGAGIAVRMPGRAPRWLQLLPMPLALDRVTAAGVSDASAWDEIDIDDAWVHITQATSGQFLPQMLGYSELGAVNFGKGCYLGQEVVARAEHRGAVKRHLATGFWRGAALPSIGDSIFDGAARRSATVVAVCGSPPTGRCLIVTTQSFEHSGSTAAGVTIEIR